MSRGADPLRRGRVRLAVAGVVAGAAAASAALAPAPAGAADGSAATVNVVHGIPGAVVKVCVDGETAIPRFEYGQKAVGVALPAGVHRVRVVAAGKACTAPAILKKRYDLAAGRNYTVVAALRPSGAPALPAFANRVGPTADGMARLTVRHTAKAPAVIVWAGSTKLIRGTGFTWGEERTRAVPAGEYRVKVALPGSRKAVIGPRHLTLRAGEAYQVHAVGSPDRYRLVVVRVHVGTS
jgi:hypothetical protein